MKLVSVLSGSTAITAFGLLSSYQYIKQIEKRGWKEIQQNVHKLAKESINDTSNDTKDKTNSSSSYINRALIESELFKHLNPAQNTTAQSLIISGPKNHGKTSLIKNTFHQQNKSFIFLDFHNKELTQNTFVSTLEDSMNDPLWYRTLMRTFYPNYNNHLIKRWTQSIRTLEVEMQSIPWIIMDGIDINDLAKNESLKNEIYAMHTQLCSDFNSASIVLSVSTESPLKCQQILCSDAHCPKWNNHLFVGPFENRKSAFAYVQTKLSDLRQQIGENELHSILDFCRLNIDDLNFCINQIIQKYKEQNTEENNIKFENIWKEIKHERIKYYKNERMPLMEWKDFEFWKGFEHEMMNDIDDLNCVSSEFELTACRYLLFDYFCSVVVVGCTAKDLFVHFANNENIVCALHSEGWLSQYGSHILPPFELCDDSVLIPSSHPMFQAFEEMMKENPKLSEIALFMSRHYIFCRELKRALSDIEKLENEMNVFEAAQKFVEEKKKELDDEQRAHLEVELLSKCKQFETRMNEATRRKAYFESAKTDNLKKYKNIHCNI